MKKLEWTFLLFMVVFAGCSIDEDLERLRPSVSSTDGYSTGVYVPVYNKPEERIHVI